jgi:ABC-type sugar transport system ATPase subunit
LSIEDNIGIGNSERSHDLDAIKRASKETGTHAFVSSFTSGYATKLYDIDIMGVHPRGQTYFGTKLKLRKDLPNKRELPFTVKVLGGDPYWQARARGKLLDWSKPSSYSRNHVATGIDKEQMSMYKHQENVEYRGLSGGEWQRLALARSFMKIKEADLLILDEPSSALDPQAEYEMFKNLLNLRKSKTTIYIVGPFS